MSAPGRQHCAAAVGDEAGLYRDLQPRLLALLGSTLTAREQTLEDACSFAWVQLIACQPERRHVMAWLYVVARRKALRLLALERRFPALEAVGDHHVLADPGPFEDPTPERARAALEALAGLPQRQRRLMALKVAGFSYVEIAAVQAISYTAVNRHLARARVQLREGEGGEL